MPRQGLYSHLRHLIGLPSHFFSEQYGVGGGVQSFLPQFALRCGYPLVQTGISTKLRTPPTLVEYVVFFSSAYNSVCTAVDRVLLNTLCVFPSVLLCVPPPPHLNPPRSSPLTSPSEEARARRLSPCAEICHLHGSGDARRGGHIAGIGGGSNSGGLDIFLRPRSPEKNEEANTPSPKRREGWMPTVVGRGAESRGRGLGAPSELSCRACAGHVRPI